MPKKFNACVKNKNSRVRRIKGPNKRFGLRKNEWRNICFIDRVAIFGHKHRKKGAAGLKLGENKTAAV